MLERKFRAWKMAHFKCVLNLTNYIKLQKIVFFQNSLLYVLVWSNILIKKQQFSTNYWQIIGTPLGTPWNDPLLLAEILFTLICLLVINKTNRFGRALAAARWPRACTLCIPRRCASRAAFISETSNLHNCCKPICTNVNCCKPTCTNELQHSMSQLPIAPPAGPPHDPSTCTLQTRQRVRAWVLQ